MLYTCGYRIRDFSIDITFSWFALFFGFSWFCWFIGLVFNCYRNKAKTGHSTTLCCFLPYFNRSLGLLLNPPSTHPPSLSLSIILPKFFVYYPLYRIHMNLFCLMYRFFVYKKNQAYNHSHSVLPSYLIAVLHSYKIIINNWKRKTHSKLLLMA